MVSRGVANEGPNKFSAGSDVWCFRESVKRATSQNLQVSVNVLNVKFQRKMLNSMACLKKVAKGKCLLSEKNLAATTNNKLLWQQTTRISDQSTLGLTKVEMFDCNLWCRNWQNPNKGQHNKHLIPTVKHSGEELMILGLFGSRRTWAHGNHWVDHGVLCIPERLKSNMKPFV